MMLFIIYVRFFKRTHHQCHSRERDAVITDVENKQNYLLKELHKPSAEDFRLGEFTEKMIQYGYLVVSDLITLFCIYERQVL